MHTLRQLLIWSWRAWPALVVLALICVHLLLIYYFCLNASATNKTISLFSQLVGGLVILYSIDSNIGIIKEKTLFAIFAKFLSEFPLIKRSIVIEVQGASMSILGGKAKVSVGRNPKSAYSDEVGHSFRLISEPPEGTLLSLYLLTWILHMLSLVSGIVDQHLI
jgi:hypothetical protein